MAHFAYMKNGFVSKVHVVENSVITDADGVEQEELGQEFLAGLHGYNPSDVIQCSYNANIRGNYPGVGYAYDEIEDAFIAPKPFESWVLDDNYDWVAPVARPDGDYMWNEGTQSWDPVSEA